MLVLATATQPTNEIGAAVQCNYHCYRDTGPIQRILLAPSINSCIPVLSIPLMVFAGLSGFTHDLMWRAHQLVHAGDDSKCRRALRDLLYRNPEVRS